MKKKLMMLALLALATISGMAQELQVKTFKELSSDISARTNRRFDMNDKACALVKVQCAEPGATFEGFVVGEAEHKTNEYWVYVSEGAKRLKLHIPGYDTVELNFADFGVSKIEGNTTYIVVLKFPSKFDMKVYAEPGFVVGGVMGPEISIGVYLGGFNVELDAMLPMASAEHLYWRQDGKRPLEYEYKPSLAFGGKLGYGINIGEKLRITPQVGARLMQIKESAVYDPSNVAPANGANCLSLLVDAKVQYMFTKNIGVSATPIFAMPIVKSKGFTAISDQNSNIKKWSSGVGVKIALNVEF